MQSAVRLALLLSLSAAPCAFASDAGHAGHAPHWTYEGHSGPEHWGELEPHFAMCADGKNQSPINVDSTVKAELEPIAFSYTLESREILNNGHTVQVNFAPGSAIDVAGRHYELKQVHFHTPSENLIAGRSFAAEAHFVHADSNGNLAVVAVMLEEGAKNDAIALLQKSAPTVAGEHAAFGDGPALKSLLPANRDYFTYSGSLTTPPCSEGVTWLVMKQPLTIARSQVEALTQAMNGPNNRPVQQLNARLVLK
jgi:carbonic anhydrase